MIENYSISKIKSKQPWFVLCAAEEYSVKVSDIPYVSHFYSFESASSEVTNAIPDGCIDILFDCDSSKPKAMVCGTTLGAESVDFTYKHRYFGVRFSATSTPNFLNLPAAELVNQRPDFKDISLKINDLFEQVASQESFSNQVLLFSKFLIKHGIRNHSSLSKQVIQYIFVNKGNVQIKELEEITGYTCRTIQRQFLLDIGMTPKTFCRIVRVQSALYEINLNTHTKPSDLAHRLGFSDQAHFTREFKSLTNTTPNHYVNRIEESMYLDKVKFY
ncbi:HTH-type transcriptional activator RhaS [Marinomonas spartinae]|uniref:HTH-type transcriptional activator RhaS n=1 Tax=Marinomonas spartinae TaxID=1792290 RepID=A0A1A8TKH9_9GAMM|nr:helix-turn-helix domain-containing protein [Marinomonas spartinae]SBS33175.1 HTH-type transcriptional activator RhaS [Marinomonas spartinae]SBS34887.1 HTH-type transcriptional activator RhaS [Marinomonas spartinae]